mmetsp:Transcript_31292/g.75691  ORF Transcript_31292/g.75691 Transcript_31292/m.75691 type:complete len:447 (-) Transcript_31292:26-1366(-)
MPKLRHPSRIEAVATPLFGMCWWADPGTGESIVACCGGGGSAATGVKNLISVRFGLQEETEPVKVTTGPEVGVALTMVKNPLTQKISLFAALGSQLHVYALDPQNQTVELKQELSAGDGVNALAVSLMADLLVVGCESGTVKVYQIVEDYHVKELHSHVFEGHSKAVSSVALAPRTNLIVSSGKDGTARIWKIPQDGDQGDVGGDEDACLAVLTCSIEDPKAPPPKRTPQVLVRGVVFGDLEGKLIYTVASGRKGRAFLSKWGCDASDPNNPTYLCIERTPCSDYPVSSMSSSADALSLALGSTSGNVILWDVEKWKAIKVFPEVHDLPVTCIAARPWPVELQGETDSKIKFNALSASADSQMAWLTLQRRGPRSKASRSSGGPPIAQYLNTLVKIAIFAWLMSPLGNEIREKCIDTTRSGSFFQCFRDDVLIAPISKPGIAVPPH